MVRYHDEEWGVPQHDDVKLFEHLSLEAAQAGLLWRTVLHKRTAFNQAFAGFDPEQVAAFTAMDVDRLMADAGIIRNRLKIESIIANARLFREIQRQHGSFDAYLWGFFGGDQLPRPPRLRPESVPVTTPESDALSIDLKHKGFKFVGSTSIYAFMQSVGVVNDHVTGCFRAPPE